MKKTDRIQRYLEGNMDEDELKKFRDELQTDPEFVQELDLHRSDAAEAIPGDEEIFKHSPANPEPVYWVHSPEKKKFIFIRALKIRNLSYAGALAFMIAALFFFAQYRKESNEALFNKYFLSFSRETANLVSHASEITAPMEEAIITFRDGNYPAAEGLFGSILKSEPGNACARLYHGLSCIYLNDFSLAVNEFNRIADQPSLPYSEYARWYLALCYIKMNNPVSASQILKEIVAEKGTFARRAGMVLRKLRLNP